MIQSLESRSVAAGRRDPSWRIHPLRPGTKIPMVDDWPTMATSDEAQIRAWWRETPDANMGIATGHGSGIFVLDVDVSTDSRGNAKRGKDSLDRLTAKYGPLPDTYTVRTWSGGLHFYFRMPDWDLTNRNKGLKDAGFPDLDIRGEGGQVAAPPSVVQGKAYTIQNAAPVADAPAWLLDLLKPKDKDRLWKPLAPATRPTAPRIAGDEPFTMPSTLAPNQAAYLRSVWAGEVAKVAAQAGQMDGEGNQTIHDATRRLADFLPYGVWTEDDITAAVLGAVDAWEHPDPGAARTVASALRGAERDGALGALPEPRKAVVPLRAVPDTSTHTATITNGTAALKVVEPTPTSDAEAYTLTDDGNAQRLVDAHGNEIRYVPERAKWLAWEGYRWQWDDAARVRELMKAIARTLPADENADRRHRDYSLSARGTSAALQQACSDARIVARSADLDGHRLHLNTPNGVVNLTTGQTSAADPAELHTRSTAVAPDEDMATPRFKAFLADTFGGNAEMIRFVQRIAGYSASGDVRYHVLPFLYGEGQNGKSVLMDVLRNLLGDYATTAPPGFLTASRQEHSAEIARLQGMRLVVASEVNQGTRFDEARVKELTGGDALTARYMRQDFFTFEPTHHLWLMGNHQPEVKAGGDSFWRRLRLVPFLHRVPDDKKIDGLADILAAEEGPGILAWIVRGAVDVFAGGLREPESVMEATRTYAAEEDHVGRFLEECCRRGGGTHVRLETKRLREAYDTWCHGEGQDPLPGRTFGQELKRRGIGSKPSNGKRFYLDLSLLSDPSVGGWGQ